MKLTARYIEHDYASKLKEVKKEYGAEAIGLTRSTKRNNNLLVRCTLGNQEEVTAF